jgi:hypothetical protein
MSSATKKFALATLSTPVLAALAIGLAGSAVAAPARPQPSDTGSATSADPYTITVPITLHFPKANPQPTSQTVRTPKRTTRGAATRAPKRGLGMDIGPIKPWQPASIVLGGGRPSVSPARPRLLGGGLLGDKTWDDLIEVLSAEGLEIWNR